MLLFLNRWHLPLLFFISGEGVAFSLLTRTSEAFLFERTLRLLLPLARVIIPPQIHWEWVFRNEIDRGFFAWYCTHVFRGVPYTKGHSVLVSWAYYSGEA